MTIYGECDKWLNERKGNGGAEEGEQKGGLEARRPIKSEAYGGREGIG